MSDLRTFKKQVLDQASPSFCAAKWLTATIWLGQGVTASCHHPPFHPIDAGEIEANPSAIHNTSHKKKMRALMQKGERPTECEYCWKIEDMGTDAISDRVVKSSGPLASEIPALAAMDPQANSHLRQLEISFDRTCQFACSYCNPTFSTAWARDIKQNGPYEGLSSDERSHFTSDAPWAEPFAKGAPNPYVDAFWRWWPELSQTLTELRITGGEPLMSTEVWKLFDWFDANPETKIRFAVNSNLGAKDGLIDRLIERTARIQDFHLYTSAEAVGPKAEYIRDGLEWEVWLTNLEKVLNSTAKKVVVMMTVNALACFGLPDFYDAMLEIKARHPKLTFSTSILRFPTFQSALVLPPHLRSQVRDELASWYARMAGNAILEGHERWEIERLIDYLSIVETPHHQAASIDALQSDFRAFYEQYDRRRGKSFSDAWPAELTDWFNSIPKKAS